MPVNPRMIRQLHRWMSIIFSIALLSLSSSAMYYVYVAQVRAAPPAAKLANKNLDLTQVRITVLEAAQKAGLALDKVQAVRLLMVDGAAWYQFQSAGSTTYVSASSGEVSDQIDEKYAYQLAIEQQGGAKPGATSQIKDFNDEYTQAFKVLPVFRFDFKDDQNSRLYVSTARGAVITQTDDSRQTQMLLFNNMHKLNFIKDKTVRNATVFVIGGFVFLISLTGILLFIMTWPRRRKTDVLVSSNPGVSHVSGA